MIFYRHWGIVDNNLLNNKKHSKNNRNNEKKIDISIIIPVFNTAEYISTCLDSVFSQTIKNIEVICIDDGSTDDSLKVLNKYNVEYENLILLKQKHKGAGVARNYGMTIAKGTFVAFMDSDDFYPNKDILYRLYNAAVEHNVLACGGSFLRYQEGYYISEFKGAREKLIFSKEELIKYVDYQCCFGFTRFIINLDFLKKKKIFFPNYQRNEDPLFFTKALSEAKCFYAIPDVVYVARYTDKQIIYDNRMLYDIAKGLKDILTLANENNYLILWHDMLIELQKYNIRFSVSIYNGNRKLSIVLSEIQDIIRRHLILELANYERKCYDVLNKYQKIIIYGAGDFAKEIYDYINKYLTLQNVDFAVTNINQVLSSTARGLPIRPLSCYTNNINDTLVVIAVYSQQKREEMMQYAKTLGFEKIIIIEKPLIKIMI